MFEKFNQTSLVEKSLIAKGEHQSLGTALCRYFMYSSGTFVLLKLVGERKNSTLEDESQAGQQYMVCFYN